MDKKDEALKMAIEALELCDGNGLKDYDFCIAIHKCKTAINACKKALEQPAQEPVAWMTKWENQDGEIKYAVYEEKVGKFDIPLYTQPAQPLSDDDIEKLCPYHNHDFKNRFGDIQSAAFYKGFKAAEQAHGIGVKDGLGKRS